MGTNFGLLANIAEGVGQTMKEFRANKTAEQVRQDHERERKMMGFLKGVQEDESGNFSYTPEEQSRRESERGLLQAKQQAEMGQFTHGGDEVKRYRELLKSQGVNLPEGDQYSVSELKEVTPLAIAKLKALEDPYGIKGLQAKELREKIAQGPKATEGEKAAAGYAKRLEQAEDVFGKLEKGGFDRSTKTSGFLSLFPTALQGSELQQQEQAERNFINATLRRESGAAISPAEFKSAEKQYFPRAGDSPEVKEQKRQNRLLVQESIKAAAGDVALGKIKDSSGDGNGLLKKEGEEISLADLIKERQNRSKKAQR